MGGSFGASYPIAAYRHLDLIQPTRWPAECRCWGFNKKRALCVCRAATRGMSSAGSESALGSTGGGRQHGKGLRHFSMKVVSVFRRMQ